MEINSRLCSIVSVHENNNDKILMPSGSFDRNALIFTYNIYVQLSQRIRKLNNISIVKTCIATLFSASPL